MFEFYKRISPSAQRRWIRNHPTQYFVVNAVLLAAYIGYIEYHDRKEMRKIESSVTE
jgi:hypothetical protein